MRLLMLNYEYPPLGGGAARATAFMAKELVDLGWEVVVLTSGVRGAPAVEWVDGVEVHRVSSLRRGTHHAGLLGAASYLLFARIRLRRLLREREFDFAHFYFALPTGLLSRYWRTRTGKPYVVSLRGSDVPGYDEERLSLRVLHRMLMGTSRRIMRDARAVVANSEALRDLAVRSFPEQRVEVVTNGVCTRTFHPATSPRATGVVQAICVARMIRRKGIDNAVQGLSAAMDPSLRLCLVGLGPRLPRIRDLARSLGVSERVVFRGHLRDPELAEAYREADVFLLPSLSESFSMALLEAMASGLPVIASDVGGIPELVEDGVNGLLVSPRNPHEIARALDAMAASPEMRSRMGRNNRRKIEARFGWPAIVKRYAEEFYPAGPAPARR